MEPLLNGAEPPLDTPAWAYLVRCPDGSLYAGWTSDLARRVRAHRAGKGARYTKMRGGAALAYAERCAGKGEAMRREAALKRLTKAEKEALAARWAADSVLTLRDATGADAGAVAELYNWYVRHSTATFQWADEPVEAMRANIAAVQARAPFLVAVNAAGALCGYACAHPRGAREAFNWTVEVTIYCAPDCVGQGVGRRLYTELLARLKAQGYHNALALVAHPNPESEAFHRAFGFKKIGTEPNTGYKFGRWLDLGHWWLVLNPADGAPAPITKDRREEQP